MMRHYLKLIWNRKRSNALIAVEILLSFLVVFAVITLSVHYIGTWRRPLGFSIDDVWVVQIDMRVGYESSGEKVPVEMRQTYRELLRAIGELPEVVAAAGAAESPYSHSHWTSGEDLGTWRLRYSANEATDSFARVMGVEITRGRWFDSRDDGSAFVPVVINEPLANEIFGDKNPVGNAIPRERPKDGTKAQELRVVGVIRDFRQDGELPQSGTRDKYLFRRYWLDDEERRPPSTVIIKARPGTTAAFEEKLIKRMQAVATGWSFEVEPLAAMRESWIREMLSPLIASAVIAGFLMLMVAMGLTGVLWQTVTQRTREIGLRRAKGATIGDIRTQVFGELVVLSSVALAVGSAIVLQFPLLKLTGVVTAREYLASLVVSAACIYLLTMACAWYPSRLATRIHPAEALHYE